MAGIAFGASIHGCRPEGALVTGCLFSFGL